MVQATEVFTPNDVPTLSYVERTSRNFERDLRNAFDIPKMVVSISGPSKSGKTVLVTKVVAPENLIHIYGATIKTREDLWSDVIAWMGGPIERTETEGAKIVGELAATAGGKAGIPFVAEGKADIKGGVSADSSSSTTKKYSTTALDDIVREIGGSDYVVFIDDFHYIERDVREEIGRQIKAAAEKGIRICTASVPHRSDDVVRSNPELRGRVTAIDMSYWTPQELEQIRVYEKTPRNSVAEKPAKRAILDAVLSPVAKGRSISMKRAVLYLRVSTTEQPKARVSPRRRTGMGILQYGA